MTHPRRTLLHRLRHGMHVPALIVLLALAGVFAVLHAASHAGTSLASVVAHDAAPFDDAPATGHDDCPVCRLAGAWPMASSPAWLALFLVLCAAPASAPPTRRPTADPQGRWLQRRKQGPPAVSR
jgi:hypothetical protein